jgi:hypothetical protein
VIRLLSRVTAAVRASSRPTTEVVVPAVIEASAKTVPRNVVLVFRVAELPTCQNTLQADAPLMRLTVLSVAVMRVLLAWKMNTAPGSFCASRVTVPVRAIELALL